jgi:uncharacterized peroxidase-related enzyme
MNRISAVDPATATGPTEVLFRAVRARFGRIPNSLRVLATSPAAFSAWWEFDQALAAGTLPPSIHEQIAVLVATRNSCSYCLSAHTAAARAVGVSADDAVRAQRAGASDACADAALLFARDAIAACGDLPDAALQRARGAGLSDAQLIEILAVIAINTFNNLYVRLAAPALDFPAVPLAGTHGS